MFGLISIVFGICNVELRRKFRNRNIALTSWVCGENDTVAHENRASIMKYMATAPVVKVYHRCRYS